MHFVILMEGLIYNHNPEKSLPRAEFGLVLCLYRDNRLVRKQHSISWHLKFCRPNYVGKEVASSG